MIGCNSFIMNKILMFFKSKYANGMLKPCHEHKGKIITRNMSLTIAKPMIFGDFEFEKYEIKTTCGLDTFVKSQFIKKSNCLDKDGNVVRADKQLSVILSLIQEFR